MSVLEELQSAEAPLRALDAVRREQDAMGEWYAELGDDVRAAVHLQCAARLREALSIGVAPAA